MIDFNMSSRRTGKTRELARLYVENPGVFYVHNIVDQRNLKRSQIKTHLYNTFNSFEMRKYKNQWIYLDEFFNQLYITYDDLITMDSLGNDIVIRGTKPDNIEIPEYFMNYLENNYPEYLL